MGVEVAKSWPSRNTRIAGREDMIDHCNLVIEELAACEVRLRERNAALELLLRAALRPAIEASEEVMTEVDGWLAH